MRLPLAVLNLWHQKIRTLVAIAGVAFAVVLLFMQLGFLGTAETSALVLLDNLKFDIILTSPNYLDINRPGAFSRTRLYQALSVDGVARAAPLYVGATLWRVHDKERKRRSIMVVGLDPSDRAFLNPRAFGSEGLAVLDRMKIPANVLMDRLSRGYFQPRYDPKGDAATELFLSKIHIAGEFTIGTGYGADGMLLMSDQTFSQIFGGVSLDNVSLGLIQLKPGADAREVAAAMQALFPSGEVRVYTRAQMEDKEKNYWVSKTSLGVIFILGVVVALIVGVVFVYQVISSDITNRFSEFATLKAMGYPQGYLNRVVLEQAALLGLAAYVPGVLISLVLYEITRTQKNILIGMTWSRLAGVLVLALAMCAVSGILAIRKVWSADPADLF